MLWLLAIFLPPVAVLFVRKPIQALLNILLCILFWIPGVIHALLLVSEYKADKRMVRQVNLIKSVDESLFTSH